MCAKLLILESPGKVKKVQEILGPGWKVAASVGHVRDLPVKEMGVAAPDGVASPLQAAANSFFGNMLLVFAALLTVVSFLVPIALVAAPIAWWWRQRRKARPPTPPKPPTA